MCLTFHIPHPNSFLSLGLSLSLRPKLTPLPLALTLPSPVLVLIKLGSMGRHGVRGLFLTCLHCGDEHAVTMDDWPDEPGAILRPRGCVALAAGNLVRRLCPIGSSRPTDYRAAPGDNLPCPDNWRGPLRAGLVLTGGRHVTCVASKHRNKGEENSLYGVSHRTLGRSSRLEQR